MLRLVAIAWYFCSYVVPRYLSILWQVFMTHTVTKAMAIQFIDDECHIMKWKSRKTVLTASV